MDFRWEEGFTISTKIECEAVTISANREGLISLANHLLALANEDKPAHFHLDENNSLEEGSCELIVERVD